MELSVRDISLGYGGHRVVERLSFETFSGEFLSLLGPSGCGKTTVLNALAGFIAPQEGEIFFDGRPVTALKPQERNIGMVFQNYALYPHMTAYDNIAFPLKVKGEPRASIAPRVRSIAALTRIEDILDRKPAEMSGGQQQRVAISRALVKQPDLLLMDEPLSNLDAGLQIEMREEILRIQSQSGVTTIFVTHDQEEALSLSHRVILLQNGRIQQIGAPAELYGAQKNFFTASFFGNPPVNVLEGVGMGGELALFGGELRVARPVAVGLEVNVAVLEGCCYV
ncbi:MAG: ABC transporter ATP-binding protein [Fretibacterium sp.]|nr:ABC transporter ATP-binding protein [Fretibacterium sp.]